MILVDVVAVFESGLNSSNLLGVQLIVANRSTAVTQKIGVEHHTGFSLFIQLVEKSILHVGVHGAFDERDIWNIA